MTDDENEKQIEARYQWLKGMKARNDKEPGKEFDIGVTGVVDDKTKLLVAHHWQDRGYLVMRRGPYHADDPMNWRVKITGQGVEAVEGEEARRAAERRELEREIEAQRAEAVRPPIGFKP